MMNYLSSLRIRWIATAAVCLLLAAVIVSDRRNVHRTTPVSQLKPRFDSHRYPVEALHSARRLNFSAIELPTRANRFDDRLPADGNRDAIDQSDDRHAASRGEHAATADDLAAARFANADFRHSYGGDPIPLPVVEEVTPPRYEAPPGGEQYPPSLSEWTPLPIDSTELPLEVNGADIGSGLASEPPRTLPDSPRGSQQNEEPSSTISSEDRRALSPLVTQHQLERTSSYVPGKAYGPEQEWTDVESRESWNSVGSKSDQPPALSPPNVLARGEERSVLRPANQFEPAPLEIGAPPSTAGDFEFQRLPASVANELDARQMPQRVDKQHDYHRLPGPDPAMAAVEQRAKALIDKGRALAGRNAEHSARADFYAALAMIAQALDARDGTMNHTKALASSLRAIRESEDFSQRERREWQRVINVATVSAGHETPVLKDLNDAELKQFSPWQARQRYYAFSQQKLVEAFDDNKLAGHGLYSLGKLLSMHEQRQVDPQLLKGPQAMVFYQAALEVNPGNHLAANELGVLLARYGQLQDARSVLQHSVAVGGGWESWRNLSIVHQRMGEIDLARRAKNEWELAQRAADTGGNKVMREASIRWVDHVTFNRLGSADGSLPVVNARSDKQPPSTPKSTKTEKPWWAMWK